MRKEGMENLTTGKIAERRDRGRQRITFVKSLCHLLNITTFQLLKVLKIVFGGGKWSPIWNKILCEKIGENETFLNSMLDRNSPLNSMVNGKWTKEISRMFLSTFKTLPIKPEFMQCRMKNNDRKYLLRNLTQTQITSIFSITFHVCKLDSDKNLRAAYIAATDGYDVCLSTPSIKILRAHCIFTPPISTFVMNKTAD
ncbi:hypothetical protein HELRODRAFT_160628 [Helobdella robusta]|uniref:Uncharacterized protein n=1 Tax=Helobdella robusta TaxID=6412 RepID=T1EQI6_HELRO|nr:hypothetical protein HELRODRAFT_160628 [Helobdella robusta]ESO06456.1 hypothetical protein HELRODRAFT_160628 [Helobdella robusta]